jgi:uncharacterized protein (DUF433 family)
MLLSTGDLYENQMKARIEVNPRVLGGKPVIRGTRIPVHLILELLAAGNSIQDILRQYPQLKEEDVKAAIEYASRLLAGQTVETYGE